MPEIKKRWLFDEIQSNIPAKKFYPPRISTKSSLFRNRLFNKCFDPHHNGANLILMESQAGNGKTTFAAQSLNQLKVPYVWYQIGPEDQDPMAFMSALYFGINKQFPTFILPLLEKLLEKGDGSKVIQQKFANFLLNNLDQILNQEEFYFVFDDVHKLKPFQESYQLLTYLVNSAAPNVSFILISRNRIFSTAQRDLFQREILELEDDELSMTRSEIADFVNLRIDAPVNGSTISSLHKVTEGWVMGVSLCARFLGDSKAVKGRESATALFAQLERSSITDYFTNEMVSDLDEETRLCLYRLALLEDVPVDLARELNGNTDIAGLLRQFAENNQFVRNLDDRNTLYAFHAVFRNYLTTRATKHFTLAQVNAVFLTAAAYYSASNAHQEALNYYLKARDYPAVEKQLRDVGAELVSTNRLNTLAAIMSGIPSDIVSTYPWMSFFFGVHCMATAPHSALTYLEDARSGFIRAGDHHGEMLSSGFIIHFHITIDALYNLAGPLLKRTEELYTVQRQELNIYFRAHIAQIIAGGYCFIKFDIDKADHYSREALTLSTQNGLDDILVTTRVIRCYQYLYLGKTTMMKAEIESAFGLLRNPAVSEMNKRYLRFCHINQLAMTGDFQGYQYWKSFLAQPTSDDFAGQSIIGPFILIWNISFSIAQGRLEDAAQMLDKAMDLGFAAANPHLRCHFHHFQAYLHALQGQPEQAISDAEKSLEFRKIAGGKRFIIFNRVILGATYAQLNQQHRAQALLTEAVERSMELDETILRSAAYFHLARIQLSDEQIDPAKASIKKALSLMRENQYRFFYSWHCESAAKMLSFAIRNNIEVEYAKHLAEKQLNTRILVDGTQIPMLRMDSLGRTALNISGKDAIQPEDLPQAQRSLLAMLVSSPGLKMSQAEVQLQLWPDVAPKKARSRFDNLISRLRKTLKAFVSPLDAKHYFIVEKGIVRLQHCLVDAAVFNNHAQKGLSLMEQGAKWQACTAFFHALRHWNGQFMPETQLMGPALEFSDHLLLTFIKISHLSAVTLADINEFDEAIRIAEKALIYDTANPSLIKLLYRCYVSGRYSVKAKRLMDQYRQELESLGYADAEIALELDECWSIDNP